MMDYYYYYYLLFIIIIIITTITIIINPNNGKVETFTLTRSDFSTVDINCGSVLKNTDRLLSPSVNGYFVFNSRSLVLLIK